MAHMHLAFPHHATIKKHHELLILSDVVGLHELELNKLEHLAQVAVLQGLKPVQGEWRLAGLAGGELTNANRCLQATCGRAYT